MKLADHVLRMHEVLCRQLFALFHRLSFVLHAIAQGTILVLALEDLLKLVLLLIVYFNGQPEFEHCTPVGYIQLQQRDVEDVVIAASLLQKLQAVGLCTYPQHDQVGPVELLVKLLAWTFHSDDFA